MKKFSVIVMSWNEEPNIEQCLKSVVGWADKVFLVDSFSTDRTVDVALSCGATIVQNEFIDCATQREWALANLPLDSEWIFFLDADEIVPENFKQELQATLDNANPELCGIYVYFDFFFLGRLLKYAYESPPVMRIVRRGRAKWKTIDVLEYCTVSGDTTRIRTRLTHMNRKRISTWIDKHNRNALATAKSILDTRQSCCNNSPAKSGHTERSFRIRLRKTYKRLPPIVGPLTYFLYRYFARLGILDGFPGFAYCFLQGFWFPFLINLNLIELRQNQPQISQ